VLEHGKPMVFGKNKDRGIRLKGLTLEVVPLGNGIGESDLLVHDERDPVLGFLLSRLSPPAFPTPLGVFRVAERPSFDEMMNQQITEAKAKLGDGDLDKILRQGELWTVS
jgi:2-oxoglutarate ferredoxin oxidoreductase subunit beta